MDPARRGGLGAGRRRLAAERRGRRLPRRAHGGRGAPGARVRERRGADRGREDAERERRPAHRGSDFAALPPRAGDPPRAPGAREEGLHLHERRRDPPGREPVQAAARALQRRDHRVAPARRRGPRREPRGRRRAAAPRLRRRGPGLPVHAARAPRGRVRGRGREARGRPGRAHLRRVRRGQDGDDEIRHALPRGPVRRHELGRRRRRDADDGHRVAGATDEPHPRGLRQRADAAQRQLEPLRQVDLPRVRRPGPAEHRAHPDLSSGKSAPRAADGGRARLPRLLRVHRLPRRRRAALVRHLARRVAGARRRARRRLGLRQRVDVRRRRPPRRRPRRRVARGAPRGAQGLWRRRVAVHVGLRDARRRAAPGRGPVRGDAARDRGRGLARVAGDGRPPGGRGRGVRGGRGASGNGADVAQGLRGGRIFGSTA